MRASEVISILQERLPELITGFDDRISVSSLAQTAGVATMTFASPHGLSVGETLSVSGAASLLPLTSLTQTGGIATAVCSGDHDLTSNDSLTVDIQGAIEADYNGTFTLLSVPTRTSFTFSILATAPASATGSPVLSELRDFGYNGLFTVASVPDTLTLTYTLDPAAVALPSPAGGSIIVAVNFRISGAAEYEVLASKYTQSAKGFADPTQKAWLFAILGDVFVSRDRNTKSDNIASFPANVAFRQTVVEPFSVYAIIPRIKSIAGRNIRDDIESLRAVLISSICGYTFNSGFPDSRSYQAVFSGDSTEDLTSAYYVHRFDFESVFLVTEGQLTSASKSVALKNMSLSLTYNSETITTNSMEVAP